MAGARTKRTPDRRKVILRALSLGATKTIAVKAAGVSYEMFLQWCEADIEFFEDVKTAQGKAAVHWLMKIEKSANEGVWQAAAWKLERLYPEDYGRSVQDTRLSGPGGGPIETHALIRIVMPHNDRDAVPEAAIQDTVAAELAE